MQTFRSTLKQLALNTTLHGCRHLAEDERHWLERVIWTVALSVALWGMTTSIIDVYGEYDASPAVTSLVTSQYPAWNVPYPAIAVCNVNKISKEKAQKLAEELSERGDIKHSKSYIMRLLRKLGHLLDAELSGFSDLQDLHALVLQINQSSMGLLRKLAPTCSDLLVRCRWKSRERSCQELFKPMDTIHGFCCVFNTVHNFLGENNAHIETLHATGFTSGLSILVDPQPENYYYPISPTYGVQVLIFKPVNYPDNTNGMIEYLISKGREMFLTIHPFTQYTSSELRYFKPIDRGCFFKEEVGSLYTAANCVSNCKMKLVHDTCRCIFHYAHNRSNFKVCDLTDIPCLSRNKAKFSEQMQTDVSNPTGAACAECLPRCTDTWYDVQSSFANIVPENSERFEMMKGLPENENYSLIHLYYPNLDTSLYKQDILYTRIELVSSIGGICSLFNGFSFLSLVEVIYFLTMRWFFMTIEDKEPSPKQDSARPYWNEIASQMALNANNRPNRITSVQGAAGIW